jgi:uncharacterized repeat protein (TIGR02543 family)
MKTARLPTAWRFSRVTALILVPLLVFSLVLAVLPAPAWATTHAAKLTASDLTSGAELGHSLAMSQDGNTLVAGSPRTKSAYVYAWNGSAWVQTKLTVSAGEDDVGFGRAVAISEDGNTVLVGRSSPGANSNYAAVYVFVRSGETWAQQAKLVGSEGFQEDFGFAVAISGNTALVGAPMRENNYGAVYAFTRDSAGSWTRQQMFSQTEFYRNYFGSSVAVKGDTAVIGTQYGRAYIFSRSAGTWSEQACFLTPVSWIEFGSAVAINGDADMAVIGAPQYYTSDFSYESGAAFVYTKSGSIWDTDNYALLTARPYNTTRWDAFGCSVAVSDNGGTIIVGAYGTDSGTKSAQGVAYAFTRNGTSWSAPTPLTPSDGLKGDGFGRTVAVSGAGNVTAVGAPWQGTSDYGAVYVYGTPAVPTYSVTVSVSGGNGAATANPAVVSRNGSSIVTFVPDPGYRVGSVTDNGADVTGAVSNNTYTISNITENHAVVVTFAPASTYSITTSVNVTNYASDPRAASLLSTAGAGNYSEGITANLNAHASDPWLYEFVNWTEDGVEVSEHQYWNFTVTSNRHLVANFERTGFTVTEYVSPAGAGSVDGDGDCLFGYWTAVATPSAGYRFSHWSVVADDGTIGPYVSYDHPLSLYIDRDYTYTAHFELAPTYTLTLAADPAGSGTVEASPESSDGTYEEGTSVSLEAVPAAGWRFTGWSGDLVGTANPATIVMTGNKSVTANFEAVPVAPTLNVTGAGWFTYDGKPHGVTVTATGVYGEPVNGTFDISYRNNSTMTYTEDPPVNAGSYTCFITFLSSDPNYTDANTHVYVDITQATPSIVVTGGTYTYDCQPHSATATATGVGGSSVAGSFVLQYNGSFDEPVEVGTYAVTGFFHSTDPNYTSVVNLSATIIITPAVTINITTTSLPDGEVAASYSQALEADGGTAPYTWAVTAGSLPGGLSLSGDTIAGTATTAGTFSFTVQVTDAAGATASRGLSITVAKATPVVTVTGGTFVYDGKPKQAKATATANDTAVAGTFTFTYTGTGNTVYGPSNKPPVNVGTYAVDVSFSPADTANYNNAVGSGTLTINPALSISPDKLPNAKVGRNYDVTLVATGGSSPYTWSIVSGSPGNLVLDPLTGRISGTPIKPGNLNFKVRVTDGMGSFAEKSYSIKVEK